jgi:NADP-dependent 3-hydroxy acid dehydrogenase YdfG
VQYGLPFSPTKIDLVVKPCLTPNLGRGRASTWQHKRKGSDTPCDAQRTQPVLLDHYISVMNRDRPKRALVTGASSGIGAATVRSLRDTGWDVVAVARRTERLRQLTSETGATAYAADLTDPRAVEDLVSHVVADGHLEALVNVAGGAFGMATLGDAKVSDWKKMLDVNVLAALHMVQGFLPSLRAHGRGTVLFVTSTAGLVAYEKGGGYVASKFAEHAMVNTLRLEEAENNLRVIEVAPGMVRTEEFSVNRFGGDEAAAAKVYEGVANPLSAEDVANVITYSLNLPHHVNLDQVIIRPVAQAAAHKVIRS